MKIKCEHSNLLTLHCHCVIGEINAIDAQKLALLGQKKKHIEGLNTLYDKQNGQLLFSDIKLFGIKTALRIATDTDFHS